MSKREPEISVIIPALNEEKYIGNAIEGLRAQRFRNFETIIVDGGSVDRTVEMARRYAKVVTLRKRGTARARNLGAKLAKGEILLFIDADTKATPNLLGAYNRIMGDSRIAAATGPILPLEKVTRKYRWGYKFVSIIFVKASILVRRPSFMGSNFAIRKSAFDGVGGFSERMITYEDWDLSNRLKGQGRMVYDKDALVYTSVRRVKKWGMFRYFTYYIANMFRYHVLKEPNRNYKPVR